MSLTVIEGGAQPPEIPEDHVEVCGLFETCLEDARRGGCHSAMVISIGDDEVILHAHIEPGHELDAVGGLEMLKREILDGRVDD